MAQRLPMRGIRAGERTAPDPAAVREFPRDAAPNRDSDSPAVLRPVRRTAPPGAAFPDIASRPVTPSCLWLCEHEDEGLLSFRIDDKRIFLGTIDECFGLISDIGGTGARRPWPARPL